MKYLKPILRMFGSKYKLLSHILKYVENDFNAFVDLFGGTGIVGLNVSYIFKNSSNKIYINDYDEILENLTVQNVIQNQITFNGNKKNVTKSGIEYFKKKIVNGFWNRYLLYLDELKKVTIFRVNATWWLTNSYENLKHDIILYLDPPYFGKKYERLYINKVNHKALWELLDKIKTKCRIILHYNYDKTVLEHFKDWNIETIETVYTSTNYQTGNKFTKEIIITNRKDGKWMSQI